MLKKLLHIHFPLWLIGTLVGVFLIRIPSLFEPFYYGDEMIYLTLGEGIRKGLVLYRDIHDNKPPLLYFLAAISGNIFWFRALLAFWMIITVVVFWYLTKLLFKNSKASMAATIIFALTTSLPFFEGMVANAELFMILPTIAGLYVILKYKTPAAAFLGGMFFSVAALFKIPSIFDCGIIVMLLLLFLKFNKKSIRSFIKLFISFMGGVIVPIAISFLWYLARGAFHEYLVAAILQNFGYVSSWRVNAGQDIPFLVKNGPLITRGVLVIVSFTFLYIKRRSFSQEFLISSVWLVCSLFAATLSERPYPHYFVQVLPSVSILLSILLTSETLEQGLVIVPLTIAFIAPVYFHFWNYSSSLYFGRFETLVTEPRNNYFNSFSPVINRNYELSTFIKRTTYPNDKIFVWGDSASIYALSQRLPPIKYVADYHIRDFSSEEETVTLLEKNPPKLIILLPEATPSEAIFRFTMNSYRQLDSVEGATIWYNTRL